MISIEPSIEMRSPLEQMNTGFHSFYVLGTSSARNGHRVFGLQITLIVQDHTKSRADVLGDMGPNQVVQGGLHGQN